MSGWYLDITPWTPTTERISADAANAPSITLEKRWRAIDVPIGSVIVYLALRFRPTLRPSHMMPGRVPS